jgi:hypothetical protein
MDDTHLFVQSWPWKVVLPNDTIWKCRNHCVLTTERGRKSCCLLYRDYLLSSLNITKFTYVNSEKTIISLPGAQRLHSHCHFSVVEYTEGENKMVIKIRSNTPLQIRKSILWTNKQESGKLYLSRTAGIDL